MIIFFAGVLYLTLRLKKKSEKESEALKELTAPGWESFQANMPQDVIDDGLVKRIRLYGDQMIWDVEALIQQALPSPSTRKGECCS